MLTVIQLVSFVSGGLSGETMLGSGSYELD